MKESFETPAEAQREDSQSCQGSEHLEQSDQLEPSSPQKEHDERNLVYEGLLLYPKRLAVSSVASVVVNVWNPRMPDMTETTPADEEQQAKYLEVLP